MSNSNIVNFPLMLPLPTRPNQTECNPISSLWQMRFFFSHLLLGIFVDHNLWPLVKGVARDVNINVWTVPNLEQLRFISIAKLFYELPWGRKNASVEVLTEDEVVKNSFVAAARTEKMCFEQRPNGTVLQIVLGDDITPEENVTTVVVHLSAGRNFSLLRDTFIIAEGELDLNPAVNGTRIGKSEPTLPTDFILYGSLLLELTQWLNDSINSHCLRRQAHLGKFFFLDLAGLCDDL